MYSVYYVATDYLGNIKTYEFKTAVSHSLAPTIGEAVLPKADKKNNKLILNPPAAYDYATFGVKNKVKTQTYVSLNGTFDDKILIKNGYYLPENGVDKVYVKFTAAALIGSTDEYVAESEVYEVKILSPESFADLMIKDGVDVNFKKVSEYAVAKEAFFYPTVKGASMQYVNAVAAKAFSISFIAAKGSDRFKKVTVKLVDSKNADETLTLTLTPNNDKYTNIASGFDVGKISGVLYGAGESSVRFQVKANSVYDGDNHLINPITRYDGGKEFNGFSSGRCYVNIIFDEFDSVGDNYPEIRITNFVSLPAFTELNPDSNDNIPPSVSLDEHIALYRPCFGEAVIPSAKAYDMVSPECEVFVTVRAPSGAYVLGSESAGVSASVAHTIKLSEYGCYKVVYVSRDEANRRTQVQYNVYSTDNVDPILEINGQIKTKAKVGDELFIPRL